MTHLTNTDLEKFRRKCDKEFRKVINTPTRILKKQRKVMKEVSKIILQEPR